MAPPQRAGDRTRPLRVDRPLFLPTRLAAKVAIGCGFHMTYSVFCACSEKVCATLSALTKVGGNTVGDSVVWREVGQELGLSKWQKGSFQRGVCTRAGSANASVAVRGRSAQ